MKMKKQKNEYTSISIFTICSSIIQILIAITVVHSRHIYNLSAYLPASLDCLHPMNL